MRLSPTITTHEMATILRKALQEKLGHEIDAISITSHRKSIEIIFDYDHEGSTAMVEADDFRHRTMP